MTVADLDPDFRNDPPRDEHGQFLPHCARCQRIIVDATAIRVWVNWETLKVSNATAAEVTAPANAHLVREARLGPDCARKLGFDASKRTQGGI
jgi:hypothetical protein